METAIVTKKDVYLTYRKFRKHQITLNEWQAYLKEVGKEHASVIVRQAIEAERRLLKYKDSKLFRYKIRKYCNYHSWTDVDPYEVVRVVTPRCVEIRAMDTKQIQFPKEFYPGGFSGHYADNRSGQKYEYISNPENSIVRIRLGKNGWGTGRHRNFHMADYPHKFYDYNF